ncbi:hypothetical protein [Actinospongicola halichondriae]|uniref:hypothetical protein n=1 Tax=Actinospongicola halichondriae TaxID=3236844 RepID=UPI003D488DD3
MNRLSKLLLIASLAIMFTGIGLAVAQPGSLGGDDAESAGAPTDETTTTRAADGDGDQADSTSTTAPTTTAIPQATTSTTAPDDGTGTGSGVGSDGSESGNDTSDDLADTGGESLIVAGLLLGAVGLELRRRSLPSV